MWEETFFSQETIISCVYLLFCFPKDDLNKFCRSSGPASLISTFFGRELIFIEFPYFDIQYGPFPIIILACFCDSFDRLVIHKITAVLLKYVWHVRPLQYNFYDYSLGSLMSSL